MSHYTQLKFPNQLFEEEKVTPYVEVKPGEIKINTGMCGFIQTGDSTESFREFNKNKKDQNARRMPLIRIPVRALNSEPQLYCPKCGAYLKKDGLTHCDVFHLPHGPARTVLDVERQRYECTNPVCRESFSEEIPFKDEKFKITTALRTYIEDLLSQQVITLKLTAEVTHVNNNIVKEIDKARLIKEYTVNGEGKELKPPTEYTRYIGVDEFLLHKGNVYATVIMDLETGHVLRLFQSKKKENIDAFMDWVGDDWMKHVEAVACDMNADFESAFRKRYPHIKTVFDHFHIVKNFNDKVITEVRKDEYKRLMSEGREEDARHLKGARYILTSNRATLEEHDATIGTVINPGSTIFNTPEVTRKSELLPRYEELLKENKLLFTVDLIKEQLDQAYKTTNPKEMKKLIGSIIGICFATENKHFKWFGNMLKTHIHGILTHAELQLSSAKVEGTNRKIKTIRWQSYGFGDDEYFFLKVIDASRHH